jgi:hypothetical protein
MLSASSYQRTAAWRPIWTCPRSLATNTRVRWGAVLAGCQSMEAKEPIWLGAAMMIGD